MFARGVRANAQEAGMWASWAVAGIAWVATAFMLRFLIALLREGAPSVCYWVERVRQKPETAILETWNGTYVEEDREIRGWTHGERHVELLENENYVQTERDSSFVALDVRPASTRMGWRTSRKGGGVLREHRF
jgi:hypothetical protein